MKLKNKQHIFLYIFLYINFVALIAVLGSISTRVVRENFLNERL